MRVLAGDAVGELVQVRLPDVRPTRLLQPPYGFGRLSGDVVDEQDRPVRRNQARGVEEVLDAERNAFLGLLGSSEEDAVGGFADATETSGVAP
jgi:hypothetical protein